MFNLNFKLLQKKVSEDPNDDFWDIPTCHVAGNKVGGFVWDRAEVVTYCIFKIINPPE